MTPNPSEYRIRRDYRTEWARLDTPPWWRAAQAVAGTVRAWLRGWFWFVWSWPQGWYRDVSYWIRPYDMCLDSRRWRWQRSGCWRMSRPGRKWQRTLQRWFESTKEADR